MSKPSSTAEVSDNVHDPFVSTYLSLDSHPPPLLLPPPLLSFQSSHFQSSRVVLRLAAHHRLPFMCIVPPEEGLSACTMNKRGTTPVMFSVSSPVSLVVVTSLTSPLQFFISHFTFHVACREGWGVLGDWSW